MVLLAGVTAACGSDSSRFADNPFTNPFSSAATQKIDRTTTQSIPSRVAPTGTVSSQPLPPMISSASSGAVAATQRPVARVASATLQNATPIGGSAAGWSASGGTPVTVGAGDTAAALSARYGVPVAAINAANGGGVRPGQSAIIPIYTGAVAAPARPGLMMPATTAAAAAAPITAAATPRPPMPVATALPPQRPVAAAQPLVAAAKAAPAAKPKPANDNDDEDAKPAGRIVPAGAPKVSAAAPGKPTQPQKLVAAAKPLKPAMPVKPTDEDDDEEEEDAKPAKKAEAKPVEAKPVQPKVAAVDPKKNVRMIPLTPQKPEAVAEASKAADPVTTQSIPTTPAPSSSAEDKPDFRWPAKGRVISGFGSKGGNGDGIAIAVPEGTSVKAAQGGVVAYAGEELKGYGKLVLVRHDNGFVSAYAHNGELNVKRGEKVSRGQTIAKSGATGNVTSPQLHFELRKGSTPVDPTKYLEN
ncbi:MAG: peptidoglycan DD-metalloendopeptidase family protein [Beijerinckiaceae bacterium]